MERSRLKRLEEILLRPLIPARTVPLYRLDGRTYREHPFAIREDGLPVLPGPEDGPETWTDFPLPRPLSDEEIRTLQETPGVRVLFVEYLREWGRKETETPGAVRS